MDTRQQHDSVHLQRGISLIEQLMVLLIIGILLGIAAPSFRRLLVRNELQSAQTDFIAALQNARSTAVTSSRRVVFCPSVDARHCAATTRWDGGWLLGPDVDHDNQPDGPPRYTGRGHVGKLTIRSSAGRQIVRFQPDGSAGGSNLTLLFCQAGQATSALSVVVSNSGRVRGAPATSTQVATCAQPE